MGGLTVTAAPATEALWGQTCGSAKVTSPSVSCTNRSGRWAVVEKSGGLVKVLLGLFFN